MSIDEARRRELWSSLRDTLGETHADTLMTLIPDHPLPALATREDIASLRDTLRSEIRAEGNEVRADLRKDFGDLRAEFGELRAEFAQLDGGLRAEFSRQMLMLGVTLGSLIVAVLGTILTLGFTGAFA